MRAAFAAIVLSLSVGAFAVAAPEAFQTWVRRVLLMSSELWPRKTRLSIEGFDDNVVKVARGADFRVVVYADTAAVVPETVQIRYRDDDGNPGRQTMAAEAAAPGDHRQPFSHNFPGLLSSLTFDVVGGDDRLRDYRIEVVDNPTVANMTLHCVYPAYMKRAPRDLPVTGLMQIPMGTAVTIRATANKPLEQAKVEHVVEEGVKLVQEITSFTGEERRDFSIELPPLKEDMRLQFRLFDADKIVGRNPVRLDLTAVADEPPKVGLQLKGIGTAITTKARLPVAGEVTDEYGIERVWFEYQVSQSEPKTAQFLTSPGGKETLTIDAQHPEALDLKELQEAAGIAAGRDQAAADGDQSADKNQPAANDQPAPNGAAATASVDPAKSAFELKEGQRFSLVIKAQDQSSLDGGPFVGSGEKYQLDIVTPDRLLAMLEARELTLRQRFETIIEEFTATRDLLARIAIAPGRRPGAAEEKSDEPLKGAEPEDAAAKATEEAAAKTPDEPEPQEQDPAEKAAQERASRLLAVERTLENTERSAHETRTVGMAFLEILEEMSNNRIDTPALSGRLRDEIANPLVALADQRLPILSTRVKELQKVINDPGAASGKVSDAVREADAILLEMQNILDKMIEMATYKQLVEKLRQVIEQQEKLNAETKRQQVERLKNLIEE
jgi:hypothetical protein